MSSLSRTIFKRFTRASFMLLLLIVSLITATIMIAMYVSTGAIPFDILSIIVNALWPAIALILISTFAYIWIRNQADARANRNTQNNEHESAAGGNVIAEDRFKFLERTFDKCTPMFRDTTLPDDVLKRYKVGLFLREPTFCDATHKSGDFVAPHRFLIISSNARSLDAITPTPWGLCIWQTERVFKVIDQIERAGRVQTTLLEIPESLLDFFCRTELNDIEQSFVTQSRETFEQAIKMPPLPELNTDDWRERLTYPIGINDQGDYFPLFSDESLQDDEGPSLIRIVLHHQASVHLSNSDYSEAMPLLHQALAVSRKSDDIDDVTGSILLTLADLHLEISDLKKTEIYLIEAFEAFKQMPHEENRLAEAATHSRLGHVYQMAGSLIEAEQNYQHALKICRRMGEPTKSIIGLLASLGSLYERMERYDDAQAVLKEAFEIEYGENGECHDAVLLNNLARLSHARGEHMQAIHYVRQALDLERNKPATDLQGQAKLLYNLAEFYGALGRADESFASFKEALEIDRYLIGEVVSIASDRQRQEFLTASQFQIHQCISLILSYLSESQHALEYVAKLIFERKSLALDLSARRQEFLLLHNEPAQADKFQELKKLQSQIALKTLAGLGTSGSQDVRLNIKEEIEHCELLEAELSRDIPSINIERRLRASGWSDIAEHLPEGAVLLEFFRLKFFDFTSIRARGEEPQQTHKYIVVILAISRNRPEIVDLGDAEEIDRQIAEFRFRITGETGSSVREGRSGQADTSSISSAAESGKHLRKLLFDPLIDHLRQSTRLIIAPDGNLCRLPFETLPLTNGTHLIDQYEISYLTSGNDLLRLSYELGVAPSHPLVIADPDFNLKSEENIDDSTDVSSTPFSRLDGTKVEGKIVAQMLGVDVYSGTEAVEGVIKARRSPAILHLATHGFVLEHRSQYLSPEELKLKVGMTITFDKPIIAVSAAEELLNESTEEEETNSLTVITPAQMMDVAETNEFARLSGKGLNNPMLRSGVALAGANSWLRGEQLPNEEEDGILTAEEVLGLNLAGTELVVLSACETGLGEILSGEGVFGLRRSFVIAGARSLVVSLWKVPDIQTTELMFEFYTRLIRGEARSEALRNAQLALKKQYPNPFYWGAFVCQGDFSAITDISFTR